ncbi:MAG: hypothetical protein GY814_16890 [Gammaproteobacteria bacterium]|nr:hypothetical protein [Gammaproteobacteria bacterium]
MNKFPTVVVISVFLLHSSCVHHAESQSVLKSNQTGIDIFSEITTGKIGQYHDQNNSKRQDLSGAASNGGQVFIVDDGGKPSDFNYIVFKESLNETEQKLPFPSGMTDKDLEGATWLNQSLIVTTSLSKENDKNYRQVTKLKVKEDEYGQKYLVVLSSADLRSLIINSMKENAQLKEVANRAGFDHQTWFDRTKKESPKSGGLNVEGISRSHDNGNDVLLGLRSPLYGGSFGSPAADATKSLNEGRAMIARISNAFSDNASVSFELLDLAGMGIRGFEYIPAMGVYVVIGGPVPKADKYKLFSYHPESGKTESLELEGFESLCRPESVTQITEGIDNYLVVLSEESGSACKDAAFTYIKAKL